ncbi:MAG: carbohydrate ABC transporter permease [Eubacteriales bacterium]|nr:carbohydrate ABC transporter permease [Eubacteriales bacterium]
MDNYKITKKEMSLSWRRRIAHLTLIVISFFCLIWFFILFVNATRSNGELTRGFTPIPSSHMMENWIHLIHGDLPVLNGLLNSVITASASAALTVYFSTLTAYAIHAYNFKGRQAMFTFILGIMMIPTQVTALGFLQLINKIGLDDNLLALILPGIAAPVTFFYIKQYMDSNLPLEIVEAARIDGSGEFSTFNRIILPIMKPAIAVQAIFTFVGSWNNYFIPALVLHSDKKKTLPILIAQLRSADFLKFDMGQVYIMIAFSIFPVIIIYLLLSKSIVGGVTAGGVKG